MRGFDLRAWFWKSWRGSGRFVLSFVTLVTLSAGALRAAESPPRPNVLFVLVDDKQKRTCTKLVNVGKPSIFQAFQISY